ncbi:hypothetical protein TUSST3_53750 [Streptomyces sp. TUS-ST3]|nr:hypothetical protein TUSST3_53750 [Streptomyces sp. TUS-ST3]
MFEALGKQVWEECAPVDVNQLQRPITGCDVVSAGSGTDLVERSLSFTTVFECGGLLPRETACAVPPNNGC